MIRILGNIRYTLKHKKAFLTVEKKLLGKNTIRGRVHDLDKVFLYLIFNKKTVSKIHRWWSKHHVESIWKSKDWEQMVIDWESARFTKADKQLTARETMYKYYPKTKEKIKPILNRFGL